MSSVDFHEVEIPSLVFSTVDDVNISPDSLVDDPMPS